MTAPWTQTASGLAVDLLHPQPEQITLHDIATGLLAPRFARQTQVRPWSIAEHSLLVAELVLAADPAASPQRVLLALLHDAHEAYTGDLISPMQWALDALFGKAVLPPGVTPPPPTYYFRLITNGLDDAIFRAFAIAPSGDDRAAVKQADNQALALEAMAFMAPPPRPWAPLPPPPDDFVFHRPALTEGEIFRRYTNTVNLWISVRHQLADRPATAEAPA